MPARHAACVLWPARRQSSRRARKETRVASEYPRDEDVPYLLSGPKSVAGGALAGATSGVLAGVAVGGLPGAVAAAAIGGAVGAAFGAALEAGLGAGSGEDRAAAVDEDEAER